MTIVKTLQPAASAEANNNSPRNPHDRARIKKTNTKCRPQPNETPPAHTKQTPHPVAPTKQSTNHFPTSATTPGNPRPNPQTAKQPTHQ